MAWRTCYNDMLPFTAIIATEFASVGLNTLFKAASLRGLSYYVFITYIYAINSLVLLPFALIVCSKTKFPSSRRLPLFWRICLLGLLGLLAHIAGFKGIQYSSPTLSSAINNLSPAFTFILAIIFRMEMVALRSSSFQAKFIGTIVSMSGALIVVLYKGPTIFPIPSPQLPNSLLLSSQSSWVMGGLLLTAQCLLFALWFIILTNTMKMYPSELVISFFHCLCVTLLCIPVGFIAETNLSAWRPTSNTAIMTFIYSGFFGPAFLTVVHSWSLHLKGPLYVAIFKPLSIVIAVVTGIIFLGDALHLGSVIGALTLSTGFYAVIWGKANEEKISKECGTSSTSSLGASADGRNPLLQREEIQAV